MYCIEKRLIQVNTKQALKNQPLQQRQSGKQLLDLDSDTHSSQQKQIFAFECDWNNYREPKSHPTSVPPCIFKI